MTVPSRQIKAWAADLGFDDCRIARAAPASHAAHLHDWLDNGCHGNMAWMERNPSRRADPREVLPGCQSVICLAINYLPPPLTHSVDFRIARYAWNDDYHDLIERRLRDFDRLLETLGGHQKCYADTGPVLERDAATAAGLGWNGKSTMQIDRQLGTWFFLAEILSTLELDADAPSPAAGHCGTCRRCITQCPTGAIVAPHQLDARKCLSYLTIEHAGPIPEPLRPAMGNRIYGCDDCLEACPWNRFASTSRELAFHARESIFALRLRDFLALDDPSFRSLFAKSPIKRIKRPRFLRNVAVAMGNTGNPDDLPALTRAAADPDPLIAEHAHWAIHRIHELRKTVPAKAVS